ncbi:MAG: DcrB-related protein [Nannocystis sp.]|nr:DcrB-related protein [Nannocystis sp.]
MSIEVPSNWRRSALVVLSTGEDEAEAVSVAIRRETLDPRVKLASYVDNMLVELARTIPGFLLLHRSERTISGHPASGLTYALTLRGTDFEQTTLNVLDRPGTVLTLIASAPQARISAHREQLEAMMASVMLDSGGGDGR